MASILLAAAVSLCGCARQAKPAAASGTVSPAQSAASRTVSFPKDSSKASAAAEPAASHPGPDFSVSLIAAGDDLIHNQVYDDAGRNAGGKGYDFTPMFRYLKPLVGACDFGFVNQETLLAGAALPLASYPCFNSPTQVGTALIRTGFNLISQANNHSMDKGFTGIRATCAFWAAQPNVVMSGIYTSQEDYDRIRTLKKDGATVAFIAGTSVNNGIPKPKGKNWCLEDDFSSILAKVKEARKTADIVLVSMHWGVEYQNEPTDSQKDQAKQLAEAGADVIIGNHPHAIQPVEWITTGTRRTLVVYALGNLISAQDQFITMVGGLLRMQISRKNGVLSIGSVRYTPIVTWYSGSYSGYCAVPLTDYTDKMADTHGLTAKGVDMSPAHVKKYVRSVVSSEFFS